MSDIYSLIQSSGPGEIKDVVADIRALVDKDDEVTTATEKELAKYNKSQLITTKVEGRDVILSDFNELEPGKFYDAILGKSFDLDHAKLSVSNVSPHAVSDEENV